MGCILSIFSWKITVTIKLRNALIEPKFEKEITVTGVYGEVLQRYMETAAKSHPDFNFTCAYYGSVPGYMVTTYNSLSENTSDRTAWFIFGRKGSLDVGVMNYKPANKEVILFDFTKY